MGTKNEKGHTGNNFAFSNLMVWNGKGLNQGAYYLLLGGYYANSEVISQFSVTLQLKSAIGDS